MKSCESQVIAGIIYTTSVILPHGHRCWSVFGIFGQVNFLSRNAGAREGFSTGFKRGILWVSKGVYSAGLVPWPKDLDQPRTCRVSEDNKGTVPRGLFFIAL